MFLLQSNLPVSGSSPVPWAPVGGGEWGWRPGAHKSVRAEYGGGEVTVFDGRLACTLQNACEAIPPLSRKSVWDKINVSHIVLIAAHKCLPDLV